jgi:uncharacterized membrane protein YbaN (DUF454 family)
MRKVPRSLYAAAGILSIGLAVAGVFLPVLPTTPFLLLAAAAFARGSPRLEAWMLGHRIFGRMIRDYRERRGIRLGVKIFAISILWLTIGASALFAVTHIAARIALGLVAAAVTWHIASFRTLGVPPRRKSS